MSLVVPAVGVTALLLAAFASAPPKKKKTGGGGSDDDGKDLLTCGQALAVLPAEMRGPAQTLLDAPATAETAAAARKLAVTFKAAAASPSAPDKVADALVVVAQCLEAAADAADTGGGGGGGSDPGKEALTCAQALALLPPELRTTANMVLAQPVTPETANAARNLAISFKSTAAVAPDAKVADALVVAAQCLDAYAGGTPSGGGGGKPTGTPPLVDSAGVPSSWDGGTAQPGKQSNPNYQWKYLVDPGDSPAKICAYVFGADGSKPFRWRQLIEANKYSVEGRYLGSVGDPNNPIATGYNFASLQPGDGLRLPKAWNPWIDQTGEFRGQVEPFPKPAGAGTPVGASK